MNDYVAADWQRIFAFNGLRSFDDFWKLEAKWFEEPNHRRGGWSGVARCELKLPEGGTTRVFLKRQENHFTRTFAHPVRGLLTFVREFESIMLYRDRAVPTLKPLYFGRRKVNGDQRAILLTEELAGFRSLEGLTGEWKQTARETRYSITRAVARLLRQIHTNGLTHNCFFPKHVFLRIEPDGTVEARVIDLEKTKRRLLGFDRDFRDMRRLNGPHLPWSRTDRVRFVREYLGVPRMTPAAKRLWHQVARRHLDKHPGDAAVFAKASAAS